MISKHKAIEIFTKLNQNDYIDLIKDHHHFNNEVLDAIDILLSFYKQYPQHLDIVVIGQILDTIDLELDKELDTLRVKGIQRLIRKCSQAVQSRELT